MSTIDILENDKYLVDLFSAVDLNLSSKRPWLEQQTNFTIRLKFTYINSTNNTEHILVRDSP